MSVPFLQRGSISLLSCCRHTAPCLPVTRTVSSIRSPSIVCRAIRSRHVVPLPMVPQCTCNFKWPLVSSVHETTLRPDGAPLPWAVHSRRLGSARQPNFFEKENIWTVPNLLSVARIAAAPGLGWLVLHHHYTAALSVFALAGISDLLDGYIARTFPEQASSLGTVLDPLADKLLVCVLFLALTSTGQMPLLLTAVVLGRDTLLVLGGFYLRYTTLPPPRTWSRYWDIKRSTLQVTPSPISKVNTALQLATLAFTLGSPVFGYEHHIFLQGLWCVTALTTIVSGAHYITSRDGFRILKPKGKSK